MMTYTLTELAALDAIGLLDADERKSLAIAMQDAPPAEQRRVQEIQDAVVAATMQWLPTVEPDALLRQRVINYVMQFVEQDFNESVVPAAAGVAPPPVSPMSRRRDWFENSVIGGRVSPLWRVAALIFASATLAFGYVSYDVYNTSRDVLRNLTIPDEMQTVVEQYFGRSVKDFLLDPDTSLVQFRASRRDSDLTALLSIFEDGRGVLLVDNLPRSEAPYQLFVQIGDDEPMLVQEFNARSEGATTVDFDIEPDLLAATTTVSWWVEGLNDQTNEMTRLLYSIT